MKFKTFILTFLMMMSCSISFGQGTETASAATEAQLWLHLNDDEIGTISLANDIKITATCPIPNGKKVTIDLNGHTLFTEEEIYIINNEGKLTITDNSEGKTGTISSTLGIYNGVTPTRTSVTDVKYDRVLTINGGVFNSSSTNGNAATIYNYRGVIKINGGEFYGEHSAITNYGMATIANAYIECLNRDNGAAAIINDFEIAYGENVNIVGIYTTVTGTAYTTGTEPTYLFAELNGTKYPSLQAALDDCTTGDNTINLLFHNSDNATVSQKEGVNITIDGNNYKGKQFEYSGTITVDGKSAAYATAGLTIEDVKFNANNITKDASINLGGNNNIRYTSNVTVKNCTFEGVDKAKVAIKNYTGGCKNLVVKNCEATGLHSLVQVKGIKGVTVEDVKVTDCKNGISVGTSDDVAIKGADIEAEGYGLRADGSGEYSLNVENSTLSAEVPVIVRKTTGEEYNLTVAEDVTLTATNGGPQVVVTKDSDDVPYVAPTVKVNVTLNNGASTFGLVAKIGNKYYSTLDEAFAVATEGQTITLLGDATPDLTSQSAITKAAVIDLGGKTLTLTEDDLYFGTTTFQNGNIVVDPSVKASTAVFWMFENQTLTFDNVNITATGVTGTYLIGINGGTGSNVNLLNGTNIIINNASQAALSAVICDNGTGNNVIIEDSYINVNNIEGRFYLGGTSGNITVDNTNIDLDGVKEGFYLRANQTLSIEGESEVEVVLNDTNNRYGINITDYSATYTKDDLATVNATVYDPVVRVKNLTELQTALVENVDKPIFATETIEISEGTLELDLNTRRVFAADKNVIRNDGATLTIKNGTIERVGDVIGYAFNNAQGALNITGTTIKGGLYTSGTSLVATNANISHFQRERHAIYAYNCNVTLNGGTYHNDNSGNATIMAAGSSVVTIKDGTFSIKDGKQELGWTSCLTDTKNTASITVEGGTFNGGFRVNTGTTMTIEGGSFNDCYGSGYNIYGTAVVKGGTFTDANAINFAKGNLAEGYVASDNGNGTFTVLKGVAKIGDTYYATLQAAIDAVQNGETITLLSDITENVTLTEKVGLYYTINGSDKTMNGSITVNPLSDTNDNRRITISNINFVENTDTDVNFISAVKTNHYPRLTISGCDFTGSGNVGAVVAVRLKSSHSVVIENCTGTGLHSFLQNTAGWNLTIDNVDVNGAAEGGFALGTVQGVTVKNCEINGGLYGIRLDGQYNNNAVIESNKINAYIPVIARRATSENVNFTFSGENVMEQTNDDEVWFVIDGDDSKYHEGNVSLEDIPAATGKVLVTLEDEDSHAGIHGLVAKIDNVCYSSLQDAVSKAKDQDVVTLIADVTEDEVLITQKADVDVTIDGNNKTFTGHMTIFGSGRHTGAETLTITNVVFQAKDGKGECIASATNINGVNSYAHNVTIDNCSFKGNDTHSADNTFAIRFPSGGVGYDLTVTGCTADDKMFGLLWVTQVGGELIVDNCTAEGVKEGIVLTSTTIATITNTTIDASNVAIRAGQAGAADGTINEFTFNNNTLKSNDIAIQIRGNATDSKLSMEKNVVSGATHISGHTKDTQLSVDANYWDGQSAPVVAEGSPSIVVNSYYADEACTQLVRNEMGSICAFVQSDRITGDVTTNAGQSLVINIIGKDGNVIGTTSCEKPELMTGFNNPLTWRINFGADDSGSWAMTWNEGNPSVNNMPEKVELYVDGDKVAEADVNYTANGDGASPVFAVRTDNNGKILGSIANTDKYNLYDVAASFNNSIENDVNTGETIELIANVSATETIWISKSITINGNENSVTSNANRIFRVNASNIKVTLNDVKMVSTAEREGTNDVRGISIDPGLSNIELTLNNSSVDFTPDSANDWSYAVNVAGNGTGHKVTVNSGTYEGANVINVHGANNKVVVKDAVLTSLYPNNDKYYGACIWVLQNQGSSVEATGNTFNGSNTVAFNLGTGTELVESDNTDNTTCMVAKIGDTYYTSVEAAINAAADGATVQLLERVIDETIAPWTGNPQHNLEKSITIQGYSNFGTMLTGGMYLGYDDSQCREHNIVVKGVEFTGKGLTVACQQNVTIEGNKFNNITEGRAIAVIGKNVNSVITNNVIDGVTTSNPGIELRNTLSATVKGNTISNTGHNALQITSQVGATNSSIVVENNTLSNWGTADNSNGEKEGRAMRINGIVTAQINGNVMSHTAAPEEFVKITGTTAENIDASKNYWNGDNPFGTNMFLTDLTSDPAAMLKNYYTNVEKTNLVTINSSVAKIGDVYYTTFADALEAVEDGNTITLTGVEGSESGEIEYIKDIEFTITGEAPNYALPIVTFQNAIVNIKDAEILIPELDARQNATINVIDSKVYDAGGDGIVKSYYNGTIYIDANSTVYTMQVTTMGYITVDGTLNATWQTNVYGNGLITLNNGATFATAGLNLIAKEYSDRDNTDADRVGKPAEIVVDGANFTVGKVYSASGADYSYNADGYGINVGTIEGKSAILTIKNGGNVNIYTGDGKTANIGADGTVNIDASTFNVECRAENGTATLANNGTMNVTGEASINIKKLTGKAINFTDVTIADAYIGGGVNAFGTNNFTGETNIEGTLSVGYNGGPAEQVVVNITGNFNGGNVLIGSSNEHVLNVGNAEGTETTAHFGQLGAFGDVNIVNADVTYGYTFIRNDFNVINSTMAITHANTYFSGNAKVVVDNSSWNLSGYANIGSYGGGMYGNADVTLMNGSVMKGTKLGIEVEEGKVVKVTIKDNSRLEATELTNQGSIVLADVEAKVTSNEFDNVPTTSLAYHKVNYVEGSYVVVAKDYVAQIYDVNNNTNDDRRYESLAEAATAAQDGETIQLLWNEGDAAISMAATFVGNKTVTITGTADVDWSKGWFFVGRGGEGNGHVIFDNAKLTSVSNSTAHGINVSGSKVSDAETNNGTVEIKNSTIVLDYLIQKNVMTLDNSTLTVKNGCSLTGRLADETENGELATSTTNLNNGSKLVVNGQNGMNLGYEGYGVLNIDATSTFEATENYGIAANGTMKVNGGNVKVAGKLDNNGTMVVAAESNVEVTGNLNVNGTLNSAGNITANIVKEPTATIQLTGGIYTTEPQDGWCAESYGAFPYDENSWVVRQISGEQTFELTAGWNWVSSYITEFNDNGLAMLQQGLGTNGIQIKNNLKSSTYSNQTGLWNGSLTTTSVNEMYKVKVGELGEGMEYLQFNFEGSYVNYDECDIILYPGWNYIGYPVNVETNVADALVLLSADGQEEFNGPSVGDQLKSQQGTAVYFGDDDMPWVFSTQFNLIPGEGYMYHNASGAVKILRYTTKNSSATTETNNRSSKYWTVDATQYSSNMTMIAMTDVEGGNYEVAAFVNGEVRGSSRPVYVESLDAYILILTISGDDVEEMTFRYYDITTGEEVEFSNRINYSSDAVVGSIAEPYMLTRGTTGIGEAEMSQVNIYPNPTTTGTEINLQATCDKVEVFNALGAKVAEYQNVDTIDALETAGIYVIRITNDSNVQNCKLVVR